MNKSQKKITQVWIEKNGACRFDLKNKDIHLYDGGLFSIEKEKILLPKIIGTKKLPNGMSQILVSKKKYPSENLYALIWIQELDETIRYLQSMQRMLNKIGFKTNRKYNAPAEQRPSWHFLGIFSL